MNNVFTARQSAMLAALGAKVAKADAVFDAPAPTGLADYGLLQVQAYSSPMTGHFFAFGKPDSSPTEKSMYFFTHDSGATGIKSIDRTHRPCLGIFAGDFTSCRAISPNSRLEILPGYVSRRGVAHCPVAIVRAETYRGTFQKAFDLTKPRQPVEIEGVTNLPFNPPLGTPSDGRAVNLILRRGLRFFTDVLQTFNPTSVPWVLFPDARKGMESLHGLLVKGSSFLNSPGTGEKAQTPIFQAGKQPIIL